MSVSPTPRSVRAPISLLSLSLSDWQEMLHKTLTGQQTLTSGFHNVNIFSETNEINYLSICLIHLFSASDSLIFILLHITPSATLSSDPQNSSALLTINRMILFTFLLFIVKTTQYFHPNPFWLTVQCGCALSLHWLSCLLARQIFLIQIISWPDGEIFSNLYPAAIQDRPEMKNVARNLLSVIKITISAWLNWYICHQPCDACPPDTVLSPPLQILDRILSFLTLWRYLYRQATNV